jgi:hypothetical protein
MRVLAQLQTEQDNLIELCSQYCGSFTPSAKVAHVREICRLVTLIGQVRDELVYPWVVHRIPEDAHDRAVVEFDLARVLVHELLASKPDDLLFDAQVEVLADLLRRRFDAEAYAEGPWAHVPGDDLAALDVSIGERLRELDRASRSEGWRPLAPSGLETLRDSVRIAPEGDPFF